MQKSLKCYECKELFPKTQLISYASPGAQTMHNYCPKCLVEKQSRDNFARKVCEIFGIKNPGPRIWTERKRLQNTYGYTDQTLIDALEYLYNVENKKVFAESLCLINPASVDKMMKYNRTIQNKNMRVAVATNMETAEHLVPIKEKEREKTQWDPDDWLED